MSRPFQPVGVLSAPATESADKPKSMPAPYLGTLVAIGLAGIAPLLTIGATSGNSGSDYVGPAIIAAGAGLRFAAIVGSRKRRLFEMVYWLFVYVFLGIAPLIQMRMGRDTGTTPFVDHDLYWQTTLAVIVPGVVFLVGVQIANMGDKSAEPGPTDAIRGVSPVKANIFTLACLALFAYYVSKVGVSSLFLTRTDIDLIRTAIWTDKTTNALIVGGTSMGLLVSTIAQMYVRRQRQAEGKSRPWLLPFLSFVTLFVCVNPVNSARYIFGTVLLAMLGAFGAYATVNRFRIVSLGAIFGMVYLFPMADMFRRSLDPTAETQNPLESMLSGDFDSFAQITNTIEYVSDKGIVWGDQLLGVLFFWVPRSIWPNKAFDTGTMIGEWKGYFFTNLSAPLWAEFYINGGWVLLVLGMLLLGVAIGRLDRKSEWALAATGAPTLWACILPFYLLIVLRGSLLQSVAFMAVIAVSCTFVTARKARPPREEKVKLSPAYTRMQRNDAPSLAVRR